MQIDAVPDRLTVHVGATFRADDVERLREACVAFGPISHLEIDFADVRRCEDSALAHLASALASLEHGVVRLRGLTAHQWRFLTCARLSADRRRST